MGAMLDNMMAKSAGEQMAPLIDMGYVGSQNARDRADKIIESGILAKRCVHIGGFGRLLIKAAPKKLPALLAAFPQIKAGETYAGTTHNWLEGDATDLKYAR